MLPDILPLLFLLKFADQLQFLVSCCHLEMALLFSFFKCKAARGHSGAMGKH